MRTETELLALLENTDDSVAQLDLDGRIVVANASARAVFSARVGREPRDGDSWTESVEPAEAARWRERFERALSGDRVTAEERHDELLTIEYSIRAISDEAGRPTGITLFGRDVTARKEAESKLTKLHRLLVDASRQAGMAEVATGILHNVGNTLNSVNVSAQTLAARLRGSSIGSLTRAAALLREHQGDAAFLAGDPRGSNLPSLIVAIAGALAREHRELQDETRHLSTKTDHLTSLISLQQLHAKSGGVIEAVSVGELIDDALRLHADSFSRSGIAIVREEHDGPALQLDRHNLLQILVNLLSNGRHALIASARPDKELRIRIAHGGRRLRIAVSDNGVGISDEAKELLFRQGFTTKRDGHGFGLHMCALIANRMGGALTCHSDGPGTGATFELDVPAEERA